MSFYPAEKNVGGLDRLLRLIVGPVLLVVSVAAAVGVIAVSPVLVALGAIVGLILTVTGLTQKCPLNGRLGMNTYRGRTETDTATEREGVERPS
ncbi:hypothetical protein CHINAEXTREME_19990 [Halobiforma lacisalsi AJ5]|uniref:Inner membrane protein YgaP-like transmembrane domain-containing protein n=1 Tax=Natronobacterium lacisalsi AJ5 TaxID=358396 RepID=M0LS25_NATLA|nr:DUF2892 domain-containing protein [Halobiforma lacisalsi]APW99911.1 hypothetical protein CHINAEXTREME_19990 [Halobiforma lacisalsi AJ5]EMA35903.1 hypothetical protein C445_03568 [Halobiforma lacisalsi AJ5]